jgi:hypothetical protein
MRVTAVILGTILLFSTRARAEHFKIELTVKSAADEATAHSDTDPPPQGVNPRPTCRAKRGEDLTLQFFFSSNFPHEPLKNVTVYYYIAPEKEAGKRAPPDAAKPRLLEGSFTMDFKPETGRVGLRQRIHIDQPGAYIVRVESQHSDSDHEHFAALDLVVE